MSDDKDNTVTWWELQVADLDRAKTFYGSVFGWTFQPMGDEFAIAMTAGGTMVGGLDAATGKGEQPAGRSARLYIQVDDLEQTLKTAEASGATIEQTRTLISEEYGWWALFSDPSGLKVGLATSNAA